jgi:phosphotransferase system HPr-like phosphotransfer protein
MRKNIRFHNMEEIQRFVKAASSVEEQLLLVSGDCSVNAKSMMGLFCFDLEKPISLEINADDRRAKEICRLFREFFTEEKGENI